MSLWSDVEAAIDPGNEAEVLAEAFRLAAFLFEKAVEMGISGEVSADHGRQRGWPDEVIREPIEPDGVARLVAALSRFCAEARGHSLAVGAFWALSKADRPDLVPLLRDQLAWYVDHDATPVYQILIALENLGEQVFRRSSSSFNEVGENLECARLYLERTSGSP